MRYDQRDDHVAPRDEVVAKKKGTRHHRHYMILHACIGSIALLNRVLKGNAKVRQFLELEGKLQNISTGL